MEAHYRQMARDLIHRYGKLIRVEYLSHFPDFEINFVFEQQTVYSGRRRGQYDIHFLSLGYVGEGPRYARAFLEEAGFSLSTEEIEDICPGAIVEVREAQVVIDYPNDPEAQKSAKATARARSLFQAIKNGDFEKVDGLLASDEISPNVIYDHDSALCIAVTCGQRGIVQKLLEAGADVNAMGASGGWATALYAAAKEGHLDIAKDLLKAGARFDIGHCPLQAAAGWGNLEVVELFIESGADVNKPDERKHTALHAAAAANYKSSPQIVKKLLAVEADPNAEDEYGNTPLLMPSVNGYYEIVRLLLAAGADPTKPNKSGHTPLDGAKNSEMRHLLQHKEVLRDSKPINEQRYSGPRAGDTAYHSGSEGAERSSGKKGNGGGKKWWQFWKW